MTTIPNRDDMNAWLGPALDELDTHAYGRFTSIWDGIGTTYPDPDDQDLRDAALSAAVQYLLGETTPEEVGRELSRARLAEAQARAGARQVALMAVADGAAEATTAREVGVDRQALRKWRGLR